jgi:hypothetical protein
MRLTLPIISMVITFCYLLKYSAGQWNTLVNFGSALMPLAGQFSVGGNSLNARQGGTLAGFAVTHTQRPAALAIK